MTLRAGVGLAAVLIMLTGTALFSQQNYPSYERFGGFYTPAPPAPLAPPAPQARPAPPAPVPPAPAIPSWPSEPPLPPVPFEHFQAMLPEFHFPEPFHFEFPEPFHFEMPEVHMEPFHFEFQSREGAGASADPEVRLQQEIFRALLRNNADRGIDIATERLRANAGDPVILANLGAIAATESTKAHPLLVSIAKTSTNVTARREAVAAVARGKDPKQTLTSLEDIYNSSANSIEVRQSVVASIGRIADPAAVPVLARIFRNDTDESIRRSAIRSLGARREPDAVKTLEDLLKENPRTRG